MSIANNSSTFKHSTGDAGSGINRHVKPGDGTRENIGARYVDLPSAEKSRTSVPLYRVRSWSEVFERADGRKVRGPLTWVGVPTKHDGAGYRRLVDRPNGAALFGCWMALVQVAAKCKPRGMLVGRDGPLSAEDLGARTGLKADDFEQLFQVACEPGIGWLEIVDVSKALAGDDGMAGDLSGANRRRPDSSRSRRINQDGPSLDKNKKE